MTGSSDWWKSLSIYQIYPRSFYDSNNDGVGDLKGITEKLPYIASLNVDAIWLSPFFTSPMHDFGYDIANYRDVDPIFGTLSDFDEFLATAHELGLKVLIDQVYSHSSDEHPWFQESRQSRDNPKHDWYVWADPKPDGSPPNNWQSCFGGAAWQFDSRRMQYYLHNFVTQQPDLNLHNEDVQNAVLDVTRFWLDRGVDGFRLDAIGQMFHDLQLRDNPVNPKGQSHVKLWYWQDMIYNSNRPEMEIFLRRFRQVLDSYPEKTSIGEIGDLDLITRYTGSDDLLHMGYDCQMTMGHHNETANKDYINRIIGNAKSAGKGWVNYAINNHDAPRVVSRWKKEGVDQDLLARLYFTLMNTLRGSICLYQGEELGLDEAELQFEDLVDPEGLATWPQRQGRDGCRTPIPWNKDAVNGGFSSVKPWLPMQEKHCARAVDVQEQDSESTLNFYRELLKWRGEHRDYIAGDIELMETPEGVSGFIRTVPGKKSLLCLFNFSDETVPIVLGQDAAKAIHLKDFADNSVDQSVTLMPWQAGIYWL
ncbi:alpha-amylase family glycosyl hydrolase [Sansalvadorimonas sp. 2012CJ34-2]|uniref:Alpha-amylase family glycosyl hydrolase n=1 Tax=Parendozoicomonas callyspongiae TaxID=2942213 RepID=A0ABT0PE59_9GAMM|nr:alpha-amylase family glycosyl hydrolase [Sansalvadorimonas sp. 2012CJ34-2]MCL6269645.1 alpha-amylase family glycosyl hydrolase [Sansalvadorimonas sp. 2012CJ34-2]